MNMQNTDDLRIVAMKELLSPEQLISEFPLTEQAAETVTRTRQAIQDIIHGRDDRLLVISGPCSIHDPEAALDYARRLLVPMQEHNDNLLIVMRVYFEKPRTTVGWKGLINDPELDDSFRINDGLRKARKLLLDLADMGIPAATEYLDLISPQYIADLISWEPLVPEPPNPSAIANSHPASHVRLVLKMVPVVTYRLPSMPSAPPCTHTIFYR